MEFTSYIIPVFVGLVLVVALIRKVDIYAEFTAGVIDGLKTLLNIFPALFALTFAIGIFRGSGCLDLLTAVLAPVTDFLGIPSDCTPLVLMRPFSGSGAISMYEDILKNCGSDSTAGRIASVMLGSTETTFYTITVYFASTKVKKIRYTLFAALIGDFAGFILSGIAVKLIFGV